MSEVIESNPPNRRESAQPEQTESAQPAETERVQSAETDSNEFPRWLRQLDQLLPIYSQFLVEGNIRDVHLIRNQDGVLLLPIVNCLWELLRDRGCEGLVIYDRVSGIRVFPEDRRQVVERKAGSALGSRKERAILNPWRSFSGPCLNWRPLATSVAPSSSTTPRGSSGPPTKWKTPSSIFSRPARSSPIPPTNCAGPTAGNWCSIPSSGCWNEPTIYPRGSPAGNDRVRTVVVDSPNQQVRLAVAERLARDLPGVDGMSDHDRSNAINVFANLSSGLSVRAMMQIRSLARSQDLPVCADRRRDSLLQGGHHRQSVAPKVPV